MNDLDAKLIIGKKKCGKSLYVENELTAWNNRIYFGTLWDEKQFDFIISTHQKRRDDKWILIESSGVLDNDIDKLERTLQTSKYPSACMIDGLFTWVINCNRLKKNIYETSIDLCYYLTNIVLRYDIITWRFVDVSPDEFNTPSMHIYSDVCRQLHDNIILNINGIKVVEWKRRK